MQVFDYRVKGILRDQCNCIGNVFKLSSENNYDSFDFVNKFIDSDFGFNILVDNYIGWYFSYPFMFDKMVKFIKPNKGTPLNSYLMWFYGYLLKYWITTRKMLPKDVYNMMPLDVFERRFMSYHTQGWEYLIERITKEKELGV